MNQEDSSGSQNPSFQWLSSQPWARISLKAPSSPKGKAESRGPVPAKSFSACPFVIVINKTVSVQWMFCGLGSGFLTLYQSSLLMTGSRQATMLDQGMLPLPCPKHRQAMSTCAGDHPARSPDPQLQGVPVALLHVDNMFSSRSHLCGSSDPFTRIA